MGSENLSLDICIKRVKEAMLFIAGVDCEQFSHAKRDQHSMTDACKAKARMVKSISEAISGLEYIQNLMPETDRFDPEEEAYEAAEDARQRRYALAEQFAAEVATWSAKKLESALAQPATVAAAKAREAKEKKRMKK